MTPDVVAVWARTLAAVPDARLLLKAQGLIDAGQCQRYRDLFREHGIAGDRVDLRARTERVSDHLALYGEVDIALDPFPYNGTTTTCEALWMGVPVVSMIGDRHVARVGATLLTQLGLTELLAANAEEYYEFARSLAGDRDKRAVLRADLRNRMRCSPLCDARGFASDFEAALRQMWRRYCGTAE